MQNVKAAVKKHENDAPTINYYTVSEIEVIKAKKAKTNGSCDKKQNNDCVGDEELDME